MNVTPIRSEQDYDTALLEVERLLASEPGTPDFDRLEVLAVLVQDYERAHYPVDPPDLASAIEYEMDKRGLTHQPNDTGSSQTASPEREAVGGVSVGRAA